MWSDSQKMEYIISYLLRKSDLLGIELIDSVKCFTDKNYDIIDMLEAITAKNRYDLLTGVIKDIMKIVGVVEIEKTS